MNYSLYKRHICGYTEQGEKDFWVRFVWICPRCGEKATYENTEQFTGYLKSKAKWYNPLSYFDFEIVEKPKEAAKEIIKDE